MSCIFAHTLMLAVSFAGDYTVFFSIYITVCIYITWLLFIFQAKHMQHSMLYWREACSVLEWLVGAHHNPGLKREKSWTGHRSVLVKSNHRRYTPQGSEDGCTVTSNQVLRLNPRLNVLGLFCVNILPVYVLLHDSNCSKY